MLRAKNSSSIKPPPLNDNRDDDYVGKNAETQTEREREREEKTRALSIFPILI
jgi:hypothetical protein